MRVFGIDNRRVLVVASSRLTAETLMFALDSDPTIDAIGYAVDVWDTFELVSAYEPDVLVVSAGGPDQLEAAHFIAEFFPQIVQIAICSGLAELEAAREAGAAICLADSCSADELLHAITSRSRSRHDASDTHLRLIRAERAHA